MTRIKICGITNLDDALAAVESGADALGFNFYERSPRYITPDAANEIISKLPRHITTFGVFVNATQKQIEEVYIQTDIAIAQLHGDEPPEFVEHLWTNFSVRMMKAFRVSETFDPDIALRYPEVEMFLLDADTKDFGGSGHTFDWSTARQFKEVAPTFFLAGGLTPENVAGAVREVQPYGVDVCSGVESSKGQKDWKRMRKFIKEVKNAS